MARNYKEEYKKYHSKPEQKKNRAKRNAARNKLEKEGRVSKGDGKDVHHKKSLKSGGSNAKKNLAVASKSKNRSAGGKAGDRAGKRRGGRNSAKGRK